MPRRLTVEISERVTAEGEVERALDEVAARAALARQGVEAIAVCLLWSIKNPAHEEQLGTLIEEAMPGVPYTLSHRLNPILHEYPRASSAAIDASLKPLMQRHLRALRDDLGAAGFAGELLVSTVSGGLMHVEDVADRPIFMVKSGPAMAPARWARWSCTSTRCTSGLYGVKEEDGLLECLNWKGRLTAFLDRPTPAASAEGTARSGPPAPRHATEAFFGEAGFLETPIFEGSSLTAGDAIAGPAIIEEPTTTVVVYPETVARVSPGAADALDPVQVAIMANRIDAILREMTGVVMRTARSAVIGQSRDFSCAIVTTDNELLAAAEGIPAHIYGAHLQTRTMCRVHPGFREGDAYPHNDPYDGNSHAADWPIIVPVFCEGEHLFNVTVKGHQADCGDSIPTTYTPRARDVYEEGALIFPCVRVQRNFRDNEDIVCMCRRRIRVPEQ